MLKQLRKNMGLTKAPDLTSGDFSDQAAVLIAVTDDVADPKVVLTLRAGHLKSHSGEVSLPGGMWEIEDGSLLNTALRESHEEIDLLPAAVEVLGVMPARYSKGGVKVTPVVGVVASDVILTPNQDELDCIFQVPLRYLLKDPRSRTDIFSRRDHKFWAPAYFYEGYEIWGLTAGLLVEFLNSTLEANIAEESDAPVRLYS